MMVGCRLSPLTKPPKPGKTDSGPKTPLWCATTVRVLDVKGNLCDVVISGGGGGAGATGQINGLAAHWLGADAAGNRPVPLAPRPSVMEAGGDIVDAVAASARGTVVCMTPSMCFVASLVSDAKDPKVNGKFIKRGCFATEAAETNEAASNKAAFVQLGRAAALASSGVGVEWLVTGGAKGVRLWALPTAAASRAAALSVAAATSESADASAKKEDTGTEEAEEGDDAPPILDDVAVACVAPVAPAAPPAGWSALGLSAFAAELKATSAAVEGVAVYEMPTCSLVAAVLENTELHVWQLRPGQREQAGGGVSESKSAAGDAVVLPRGCVTPALSVPARKNPSVARLISTCVAFVESGASRLPYVVTVEQHKPKVVFGKTVRDKTWVQPPTKIVVRQVLARPGKLFRDIVEAEEIATISCGKMHVMCLVDATAYLKGPFSVCTVPSCESCSQFDSLPLI